MRTTNITASIGKLPQRNLGVSQGPPQQPHRRSVGHMLLRASLNSTSTSPQLHLDHHRRSCMSDWERRRPQVRCTCPKRAGHAAQPRRLCGQCTHACVKVRTTNLRTPILSEAVFLYHSIQLVQAVCGTSNAAELFAGSHFGRSIDPGHSHLNMLHPIPNVVHLHCQQGLRRTGHGWQPWRRTCMRRTCTAHARRCRRRQCRHRPIWTALRGGGAQTPRARPAWQAAVSLQPMVHVA